VDEPQKTTSEITDAERPGVAAGAATPEPEPVEDPPSAALNPSGAVPAPEAAAPARRGAVEGISRLGSVEAYWELSEPAFDNSPNQKFFYPFAQHQEALIRLEYAVRHRKGCALLTGEDGSGKTMLVRRLLHRLERERYDVGLVATPCGNAVEFLTEVLYQLGVETRAESKLGLLHVLSDLLFHNYQAGRDTLIVIEEAQLIEHASVFEELRLLTNVQTDDRFLATVLLVGSRALQETLRHLGHVEQRIAIRCHLGTLDLAQTASYIAHRLKIAGLLSRIFTDDAIELIFKLSGGAPRKINNICDTALMVGYNTFALEIDPKIVADCAKTPERAPGEEPSGSSSSGADPATDEAPPGGGRPVDAAAPKDPWWPHKYL